MSERLTTRRDLLKATGALGTIAALAAPIAILPKAEAAEMADAELLAMGRELEAMWVRERELVAEGKRLGALANEMRPAPEPVLLAYEHDGRFLMERLENGSYWANVGIQNEAADIERCWRVLGFREGPCPEAEVLAALERWKAGGREADDRVGVTASEDEFDRVTDAIGALCDRIIAQPARSMAGLKVKLRALDWCYPDTSHHTALEETRDDEQGITSPRLIASTLIDALAILTTGATA